MRRKDWSSKDLELKAEKGFREGPGLGFRGDNSQRVNLSLLYTLTQIVVTSIITIVISLL